MDIIPGNNRDVSHRNHDASRKSVAVPQKSVAVFSKYGGVCKKNGGVSAAHGSVPHRNFTVLAANFTVLAAVVVFFCGVPTFAAKDDVQITTALVAAGSNQAETNAGDFVADAVREKGSADIAFVPAADMSDATVGAGNVSPGKVLAVLGNAGDSSNTVVVLNLTGAQILKALERSVSRSPGGFSGFLQVSGVQIRYSNTSNAGKRVILAGTGGSDVDVHKTYKVATTKPLALGNLGYFEVWKAGDIAQETGASLARAVTDYVSSHKAVNVSVEGRIVSAK